MESAVAQVKALWIALAAALVLWTTNVYQNTKSKCWSHACKVLWLSVSLYLIGLWLIYLFSMSMTEANANHLACFYRYIGTISIFALGLVFYTALSNTMIKKETQFKRATVSVLLLGILWVGSFFDFGFLVGHRFNQTPENYQSDIYRLLEENAPENHTITDMRYYIIWDDLTLYGYHTDFQISPACQVYFLAYGKNVTTQTLQKAMEPANLDKTRQQIENCDYVLCMGDYHNSILPILDLLEPTEESEFFYKVRHSL